MKQTHIHKNIVLFDGECAFCNQFIVFLLKHNKEMYFASLNSKFGRKLLTKNDLYNVKLQSIIYLKNSQIHIKSNAVLLILKDLGGIWHLMSYLRFLPIYFRDIIYEFIAKHRYKIIKAKKHCIIPNLEDRERILY